MKENGFEEPNVKQTKIEFPEPDQEASPETVPEGAPQQEKTAVERAGITPEELEELDKKDPDYYEKGQW